MTTLTASAGTTDAGVTYTWTITHVDSTSGETVTDYSSTGAGLSSIGFVFTSPSTEHTVSVTATSDDGSSLSSEQTVMVKYVRREIRDLSENDREKFLAATEIFHRLDADVGRAQYGAKFTNYKEITVKHLARMTLDKCTPYHGYDTFLPAHEAFILEFEQALQTIDASISVPYWDFSLDTVKYGSVDKIAASSEIFQYDWFGPLDNSANADVLTSKYFANIPVPLDSTTGEHNGYGFITDSINANPSQYVTRSASVCGLTTSSTLAGCSELEDVLSARSFTDLRTQIESVYHATLHMSLGGVTDCGSSLLEASQDTTIGGTTRLGLFQSLGQLANTVWRSMELSGTMVCEKDCDLASDSFEDCSCSCPATDSWDDATWDEASYDVLTANGIVGMLRSESTTASFFEAGNATATVGGDAGALNSELTRLKGATVEENTAFWTWMLQFSCGPGKMGPFATPLAATNDPIFWVTHASWGRYWHYIQLTPSLWEGFHNDWSDPTEKTFMDNFQNISNCEHMLKASDTLPFKGFTENWGDLDSTNGKLVSFFAPTNVKLPYVYATFDMSQCDLNDSTFYKRVEKKAKAADKALKKAAKHTTHTH